MSVPRPSRRGLPPVRGEVPSNDNSAAAWLRRLVVHTADEADSIHQRAVAIHADNDLSDSGKRRRIATDAGAVINKLRARINEEREKASRERSNINERLATRLQNGIKLTDGEKLEWRGILRSLSVEQRRQLLMNASNGVGKASAEIMSVIATASHPLLIGLDANDPLCDIIATAYRSRLAASEVQQLDELNQAETDAITAINWLESYAGEIAGHTELRDATAVAAGKKPPSKMSVTEKVAAINAIAAE